MPYITQEDRKIYDERLDDLCFALEEEGYIEGHVTYVLYMIVARWFKHMPLYSSICRIRGVLTGTQDEFDRRIAAPYEDRRLKENGDVDLEYNPWRNSCVHGEKENECEVCAPVWDGTCSEPGCTGPSSCPSCKPILYEEPADKTMKAPKNIGDNNGNS